MGLPIAPVTANIFMECLEDKALENAPVTPRYWWRYVDDFFAIVSRSSSFTVETEMKEHEPVADRNFCKHNNCNVQFK